MAAGASRCAIDEPIVLRSPSGEPVRARLQNMVLLRAGSDLAEARLTLAVSAAEYARIDREHLFNLRPDVRGPMLGGFEAEKGLDLDLRLSSRMLERMSAEAETAEQGAIYLLDLCQHQPADPLLYTENWYAVFVKQEVTLPPELQATGSLMIGYRTRWDDGLALQDGELGPLLNTIAEFFSEDGWPYERMGRQPVLSTTYQGENAEFACYAYTREEQQRCAFYSLAPEAVPPERRAVVAELLTRANYGLMIGDFEMDFADGEIRFKTSLDVEGDRLTVALARQLAAANVGTMDRYYPAILAVARGQMTPAEAIAQVED